MLRRRRQIAQTRSTLPHSSLNNPYGRHDPSYPSSSDDDGDEEQVDEEILLQRQHEDEEEAEQERLLSERHGEANESSSSSSPSLKRQTDADIANALDQNLVQKKKKPRATLTATKLISPSEGVIQIRHEFGKIRYRPPKEDAIRSNDRMVKEKRLARDVQASAVYLSKLIQAYEDFAVNIAPSMHYSDTFRKIQDLGGKKEVRDYLNTMRQEICKEHLQKMYGKERAEKFLNELELEHGLQSSRDGLLVREREENEMKDYDVDDDAYDNDKVEEANRPVDISKLKNGNAKPSHVAKRNKNDSDQDEEDVEASFDDVRPSMTSQLDYDGGHDTDAQLQSFKDRSGVESNPTNQAQVDPNSEDDDENREDDVEDPSADAHNLFFEKDKVQHDEIIHASNNDGEGSTHEQEEEEKVEEKEDPSDDNQAVEYFQTQDSSTNYVMFQSQENSAMAMTQDTSILLGASLGQTQEMSQDTLVVLGASLGQTQEMSQDTSILLGASLGQTQEMSQDTSILLGASLGQTQEMSQDTSILLGASLGQTQEMSQDTLVVDASSSLTQTQTQQEYEATQDTLIFDVSQEMANTQNTCHASSGSHSGSQDY
eukprot:CAMPEP_0176505540 /NCGR_PEP_ID=MMETSP0200_2-20121128/16556_1 /TAXON_ID=947934 /ORGANISM="Chaetoceros sp., Strain GSL56" /LENGTH=598 /DNA_ID=CAMNT_0017905115 /DNA_START=99 /DNA_END=1895 /DNA_ORIENTATION=+